MTTLADRLNSIEATKKGPRCEFGSFLEHLAGDDPEGHAALQRLLDETTMPATTIAGALREAGHVVSVHSMRRHRKRGTAEGCTCP